MKTHEPSLLTYNLFQMNDKMNLSIPTNFALCLHTHCPMAKTCLHQIAFCRHAELGTHLRLLNPTHCSPSSQCSHYLSNIQTTFARGFKNFQKQMFPDQYKKFMSYLILYFGRNAYFMRRRGDLALSPDEQTIIYAALKKSGVNKKLEFDNYEEDYLWKS